MKIGYLASDLITSYNCTIWNGIQEVCAAYNATFLYFSGGILHSPDINQSSRNRIFDLVSRNNIDGLIINSATIFHYLSIREIEEFYQRFSGIPIVNIGVKFRDVPTIINDNSNGMKDLSTHLLDVHKYKRIAFISGPGNNFDSNIRMYAFKNILELYGVSYNEKLLVEGDFYPQSGINGMQELLDRNISFDAVVCLSDDMAMGAMITAQSENIVVPNELAITGFDDIPESSRLPVPLTTVRQPICEQARTAVKTLLKIIDTNKNPGSEVLPTRLKIRRSCGCLSRACKNAGIRPGRTKQKDNSGYVVYLSNNKSRIIRSIKTESGEEEIGTAGNVFFDGLMNYLDRNGKESALADVDLLLNREIIRPDLDYSDWQDLVSGLISKTAGHGMADEREQTLVHSYWQRVRILVHEMNRNSLSFEKLENDFANNRFREVNGKLVRSFNISQLMQTIRKELPKINVKACYICLYDTALKKKDPAFTQLLLAYNNEGSIALPTKGISFASSEIIPQEIVQFTPSDFFIVEALFFESEALGYILFQMNPRKVLFEELRQQISSALKGALLSEEVESLLLKQKRHLDSLEEANRNLKENQEKIMEIEKMIVLDKLTSLSRLTAGLAHELNTPLASIRASVMDMETLIEEYRQSAGDPDVGREDHLSISAEMAAANDLIGKAAERAVGYVQGIKMQTREPEKLEKTWFNPIPTMHDAVLLLNHTLRKYNCTVRILPPDEPLNLYGNEARFAQVITNLLVNAIDAAKQSENREIIIETKKINTN
ncbi:MAG: substrate-binding domain-containing protein, partial [Spirochaetales bacterium]|nr:substrate-binding domain-containing protein [Spirochaetales bacterium]